MAFFGFIKTTNPFLNKQESDLLAKCIQEAEAMCSGEIRVFIEAHCPTVDPTLRARSLFNELHMYETEQRNGVLIYIAHTDHEFALIADRGIYKESPQNFWSEQAKLIALAFREQQYLAGLKQCIESIGALMAIHFPPNNNPKNELPDEIVFGK